LLAVAIGQCNHGIDGNSLGALPKATPARIAQVIEQEWGNGLIRSWNRHGWIDMQQRVGAKIGRLIGAGDGETIVTDSTSINVFKALDAALQLNPDRRVILSERDNFPTDLYMAQGLIAQLGGRHELRLAAPEEFPAAIEDDRLRLIFTCCHPALAIEARVALTLRSLGGLSTAEIARALVAETSSHTATVNRAATVACCRRMATPAPPAASSR